jgi:hypothetical protein
MSSTIMNLQPQTSTVVRTVGRQMGIYPTREQEECRRQMIESRFIIHIHASSSPDPVSPDHRRT